MNSTSLAEVDLLAEVTQLRARTAELEAALAAATTARLEAERSRADERVRHEAEVLAYADAFSHVNAEMTHVLQVKDAFLTMISHEVRTPLNVILGNSEALNEEIFGPLSPQQRQPLKRIDAAAGRLLVLLSDTLDLTALEAGEVSLEVASLGVHSLCKHALQRVAERAQKQGIQIQCRVADGVPTVRADERRLLQILVNLLDNAVKFTPAGGRVGLEVEANALRTSLTFTVWDTGIGIAEENLEWLFQPFRQVDERLARSYEGMGLGLTLAQRLAELHGSNIQVTSRPGAGSRFTLMLPAAEGGRPALSPPSSARPEVQAPGSVL